MKRKEDRRGKPRNKDMGSKKKKCEGEEVKKDSARAGEEVWKWRRK